MCVPLASKRSEAHKCAENNEYWTKPAFVNQDEGGSAEEAGPLAEISFWRERSADLSSLRTQLDSLSELQAFSFKCAFDSTHVKSRPRPS